MSRSKIKVVIITGITFLACYFVILRIYSIPVEESFVLKMAMLLLFVLFLAIDFLLSAGKSKKDNQKAPSSASAPAKSGVVKNKSAEIRGIRG
ncbi:MAG: hypothetical protein PHQ00_03045 [Phycisphaerae bacterium]|nr:hypothetical protein [Phycisphaerae bacterium]